MSRLISEEQDRGLWFWERLALWLHIFGCGPCRRFRQAVRWLAGVLPREPNDARLSGPARERIQRAIREAGGG
jgi:hypothetical protein